MVGTLYVFLNNLKLALIADVGFDEEAYQGQKYFKFLILFILIILDDQITTNKIPYHLIFAIPFVQTAEVGQEHHLQVAESVCLAAFPHHFFHIQLEQ